MKLISHRGNTQGKTKYENYPDYILDTLECFDCEIDVWYNGGWWLGHDNPQYEVDEDFLSVGGLWCHAKSIDTLYRLLGLGVHCFFHSSDDAVLTSRGFIWTYPEKKLTAMSICVLPQTGSLVGKRPKCAGICSDEIVKYR